MLRCADNCQATTLGTLIDIKMSMHPEDSSLPVKQIQRWQQMAESFLSPSPLAQDITRNMINSSTAFASDLQLPITRWMVSWSTNCCAWSWWCTDYSQPCNSGSLENLFKVWGKKKSSDFFEFPLKPRFSTGSKLIRSELQRRTSCTRLYLYQHFWRWGSLLKQLTALMPSGHVSWVRGNSKWS